MENTNVGDVTIKLILIGESGVGKTSLMMRFATGSFGKYASNVGLDFQTVAVQVDSSLITCNICDTAGQERFKAIPHSFYRQVDGIILVYDVTKLPTFLALSAWLDEIKVFCEHAPVLIVGNKIDEPIKAVTLSIVKSFAKQNDYTFLEASAKENTNVEKTFFKALQLVLVHKLYMKPNSDSLMRIVPKEWSRSPSISETQHLSLEIPSKISKSRLKVIADVLSPKKDVECQTDIVNLEKKNGYSSSCCYKS